MQPDERSRPDLDLLPAALDLPARPTGLVSGAADAGVDPTAAASGITQIYAVDLVGDNNREAEVAARDLIMQVLDFLTRAQPVVINGQGDRLAGLWTAEGAPHERGHVTEVCRDLAREAPPLFLLLVAPFPLSSHPPFKDPDDLPRAFRPLFLDVGSQNIRAATEAPLNSCLPGPLRYLASTMVSTVSDRV